MELWARMQRNEGPSRRLEAVKTAVLRRAALKLGPRAAVATALRNGPHRLRLKDLLDAPHGIDLGALKPALPAALDTVDKRIQLVPEIYKGDLARLRREPDDDERFPLRLIGRRHLRSNNSWLHNSARLMKGKDRCTLLLHPDDAGRCGLADGDLAKLESAVASARVPVELSEDMMPGVVSLPHGWGHSRKGTRLRIAEARGGVSLNDLTDDSVIDELSGNAALNGVPVRLSAD